MNKNIKKQTNKNRTFHTLFLEGWGCDGGIGHSVGVVVGLNPTLIMRVIKTEM